MFYLSFLTYPFLTIRQFQQVYSDAGVLKVIDPASLDGIYIPYPFLKTQWRGFTR